MARFVHCWLRCLQSSRGSRMARCKAAATTDSSESSYQHLANSREREENNNNWRANLEDSKIKSSQTTRGDLSARPHRIRMNPKLSLCLMFACVIVAFGAASIESRVTTFDRNPLNGLEIKAPRARVKELVAEPATRGQPGYASKTFKQVYTPVLFWHGMGDTAYGSINIDRLALQKSYPGMRVYSVQIGDSMVEDEMAGYFHNVNDQIEQVCRELLSNQDIRRAGALNAVGFSQGSQFLRGLVERCPLGANGIRVKNLITLGGQHQGVFGLPNCESGTFCEYIRYMLNGGAYRDYVQQHLVQAEYWHDPLNEAEYKAKNIFLPDINNENRLNETYRANLLALDNLVLVKFEQDEMVLPRESSHFEFYAPGQDKSIVPLQSSSIYIEDRLGLKQLNQSGRLKLIAVPGRHLQYKISWFIGEIAAKYLAN